MGCLGHPITLKEVMMRHLSPARLFMPSLIVLCAAISPALADDLVFMLNNQTSTAITEFYTSPTDVDNWEDDLIGSNPIASGDMAQVTIADGRSQCTYDLRIVFDDGAELIDTQDLCEIAQYDVSE
jgi:hypothetical protein